MKNLWIKNRETRWLPRIVETEKSFILRLCNKKKRPWRNSLNPKKESLRKVRTIMKGLFLKVKL